MPASVVTTPKGVTRRMQKFPVSATTRPPCGSTARPEGNLNRALVPRLSENPCTRPVAAPPASTDVAKLVRSTTLMRCALYSKMKSLGESGGEAASIRDSARATGELRSAAVPIPPADPTAVPLEPPPTREPREAFATQKALTLLLLKSAINRVPVTASYARPRGEARVVAPLATAPSLHPREPLPAALLTPPRGLKNRMRLFTVSLTKYPLLARATPLGP